MVRMLSSISCEAPGLVTVSDEARHGLENGDHVTFSEVQGMAELNDSPSRPIKVKGSYTFTIEDTTGYGEFTPAGGGYVRQVKQPKTLSFLPLREALAKPEFLVTDFGKFDRAPLLHLGAVAHMS